MNTLSDTDEGRARPSVWRSYFSAACTCSNIESKASSVLPGNLTQQFTAFTAGEQTTVQAEQSDGSTFTLVVPLAPNGVHVS